MKLGWRLPVACLALFAAGCDEEEKEAEALSAFELRFGAVGGELAVDCSTSVTGLGPTGAASLGVSDLRFYVSNLQFWDAEGQEVAVTLDENAFQFRGDSGQVSLVDLTGNSEGTCAANAIAFAEGTGRVNTKITGKTSVERVKRVTFDVGVPQALMKEVIGENTAEGAPSPLAEMYWTWASGYRHFVLNVALEEGENAGDGYIHLGSMGCGEMDGLALEGKDACDFVNTPRVALDIESLADSTIVVDVAAIVAGLDFVAPVYDPMTFEVIGENLGLECHSSPMQADCGAIFSHFGLDLASGAASAGSNAVFLVR